MKNAFAALFLLVGACGSDVDLPLDLDLDRGAEESPPDEEAPPPGGEGSPPGDRALIGDPEWWSTDLASADWNSVGDVDWAEDGSLVAAALEDFDQVRPGAATVWRTRLYRFAADGAQLWSILFDLDELDTGMNVPGSAHFKGATIDAIDQIQDGTIVVALNASVSFGGGAQLLESTRTLIQWYEPDGDLVSTVNLGGMTAFPKNDSRGDVAYVNSLRALSDGSVVWTGMVTRGVNTDGLDLVAQGAIGRVTRDGERPWTVVLGGEGDFPQTISPEEEMTHDVRLLPDGGIAVCGEFHGNLEIGDRKAHTDDYGTFVARLDLDGNVTWLHTFDQATSVGWWERGAGLGVADSGNVVTMVTFDYRDVRIVEIDPQGKVAEVRDVEWPPQGHPYATDGDFTLMSVWGDFLVTAGNFSEAGSEDEDRPAFVAIHDVAGDLLDVHAFGPSRAQSDIRSLMMDVGPQGQVAVGGAFIGVVDFGDGPVEADGDDLEDDFLVVFGPPTGTDVD